MIKFFRKIRQNLLAKKKFSEYLVYAVGEIILVVIGILIALQINNWNLKNQQREIESVNLIALQEEFKLNKENLEDTIEHNESIISETDKFIQTFKVGVADTISERTIANNIFRSVSSEANFVHSSGVLTEIISSGELKLIENNSLKHKLAGFGSWIERVELQEKGVNELRKDLEKLILESGNFKKIATELGYTDFNFETPYDSISNKSLFHSLNMLNHLIIFKFASETTTVALYQPLEDEIDEILRLINSELEKE